MALPRVDLSNIQPKVSMNLSAQINMLKLGSKRRNQKCLDGTKSNNTQSKFSIPTKGIMDKWDQTTGRCRASVLQPN